MRTLFFFLLLTFCLGCSQNERKQAETHKPRLTVDQATAGSVSGTISFEGTVPKSEPIDMSQDPACVMGVAPNFAQAYVVSKDGKLANVYVYIKSGFEKYSFDAPKEPVLIDQNGCRYVPHVAGAMVGQTVRVKNSDNALHNVHPAPEVNKAWNISQQPHGDDIEKTFTEPELMIPVKCNQHPWMKMYLNISPHPYFTVSATDGKFEIKGLPPGEYTLAALHERLGEKTMKVTVAAKGAKQVDFSFRASDAKN
jgi:plastocyanin